MFYLLINKINLQATWLLRATTAFLRPCFPTSLFHSVTSLMSEFLASSTVSLLLTFTFLGQNNNFHSAQNHCLEQRFPASAVPHRRKKGFGVFFNLCSVPVHSFLAAIQICPIFSYLSSFPLFSFHFLCNFSFFHFL